MWVTRGLHGQNLCLSAARAAAALQVGSDTGILTPVNAATTAFEGYGDVERCGDIPLFGKYPHISEMGTADRRDHRPFQFLHAAMNHQEPYGALV